MNSIRQLFRYNVLFQKIQNKYNLNHQREEESINKALSDKIIQNRHNIICEINYKKVF